MGQVYPTGNVVTLYEQSQCSPSYDSTFMDPRFQFAGITQSEFVQKIQAVNAILKKHNKCWVIVALFVFITVCGGIGLLDGGNTLDSELLLFIDACAIFGVIGYICHDRNVLRQKIYALFQEWQPRGISIQKIDGSKHQRGALCFIFSATNVLAPTRVYQQQAPVMGIVQQQAPIMGIVQQQPVQVQMGVVQPMVPQLSYGEPVRPMQPMQPMQPLQQQGVMYQATPIVIQPQP